PVARDKSVAFIAYPGIFDVVRRSPGEIGPFAVVACTYTRPLSATSTVPAWAPALYIFIPVLIPPAPLTTPATRGSYGWLLTASDPGWSASITSKVPGPGVSPAAIENGSARSPPVISTTPVVTVPVAVILPPRPLILIGTAPV